MHNRSRGVSMLRLIAGAVLFALGAALFLYPVVSGWAAQRAASAEIARALAADRGAAVAGSGRTDMGDAAASERKRAKDGDAAYSYLLEYNARVASGSASPINDPWGMGSNKAELNDVGLTDGMVGSVSVPALGATLPLYLGATRQNMAKGAAVVAGTSMPLGQTNSNCVIAAHRGAWSGLPMFRDIENIQVGDRITIETPWDELVYHAVETKVVSPDDTDAAAVQPGRDLVTLLTCHPYGHNYQRYLVVCERDIEGSAAHDTGEDLLAAFVRAVGSVVEPSDSPLLVAERWLRVAGFALMAAMAVGGGAAVVRNVAHAARRKG